MLAERLMLTWTWSKLQKKSLWQEKIYVGAVVPPVLCDCYLLLRSAGDSFEAVRVVLTL